MNDKKNKKENRIVALQLETELYNTIEKIAKIDDRSISSIIRLAIKNYIKDKKENI